MVNTLGNRRSSSRIDRDLWRRLNEQVQREEWERKLKEKQDLVRGKVSESPVESKDSPQIVVPPRYRFFHGKDYGTHASEMVPLGYLPTTTKESLRYMAKHMPDVFRDILYPHNVFHLGNIVKTSEGIFVNPPYTSRGNFSFWVHDVLTDERHLMSLLDRAQNVDGVYLVPNSATDSHYRFRDFGFAPYDSFRMDRYFLYSDLEEFVHGGFARVLEHTQQKKASCLEFLFKDIQGHSVELTGFSKPEKKDSEHRVLSFKLKHYIELDGFRLIGDGHYMDFKGSTLGRRLPKKSHHPIRLLFEP